MSKGAATKWLTPEEALQYLQDEFGVEYHPNTLIRKAGLGEIPSRKVGKFRRFLAAELDAWARGEWSPATAEAS